MSVNLYLWNSGLTISHAAFSSNQLLLWFSFTEQSAGCWMEQIRGNPKRHRENTRLLRLLHRWPQWHMSRCEWITWNILLFHSKAIFICMIISLAFIKMFSLTSSSSRDASTSHLNRPVTRAQTSSSSTREMCYGSWVVSDSSSVSRRSVKKNDAATKLMYI